MFTHRSHQLIVFSKNIIDKRDLIYTRTILKQYIHALIVVSDIRYISKFRNRTVKLCTLILFITLI